MNIVKTLLRKMEKVNEIVAKWLEIFNLQSWVIKIKFKSPELMGGDLARVRTNYNYYRANISVRSNAEYEDFEYILLHELTHILVGETDHVMMDLVGDCISEREEMQIVDAGERTVSRLVAIFMKRK